MINKISRRSNQISGLKKKNTSRVAVKLRKYPAKAAAKPFLESYDLPQSYNSTNLTLIARDPHWIYAYWEIASSSIDLLKNKLKEEFNKAAMVLRMYDITYISFNGYNANRWFDIEVSRNTNNWYINLWSDNVSYYAELGLRISDGRFFSLVRSNFVTTPRINPSERSEQIWMEVKNNSPQAAFIETKINRGDRAQIKSSHGRNRTASINTLAQRTPKKWEKINLTEDDIRAYYSKLSLPLRDLISERLSKKSKKSGFDSSMLQIKQSRFPLEELINLKYGEKGFAKRLLLGSSEELLFSGASETLMSQTSQQNSPKSVQTRNFFFEIATELIVYGRTQPDAKVRLGDKNIALRNDGTFSLRFALPDGKIPLDFVAISNDESEKRRIWTAVERTKTESIP